jgi:hypothetical protein
LWQSKVGFWHFFAAAEGLSQPTVKDETIKATEKFLRRYLVKLEKQA